MSIESVRSEDARLRARCRAVSTPIAQASRQLRKWLGSRESMDNLRLAAYIDLPKR